MSGVQYQSECPATPPETLLVKTTSTTDGDVQHVNLEAMSAGRVQTPTGNVLQVQIGPGDVISNLPVVIDYDHHQLHEGETFRWATYVATLASGSSKDVRLVVPNIAIPVGMNPVITCPHFRFEVISSGNSRFYLYEDTTFTGNGTQRTPIALERNGAYTPKLQIWEDPTVNAVGTQLFQGVTLAAKQTAGALDDSRNEFILKNNTSYDFRITSGVEGLTLLLRFVWYEDLGV